MFSSVLSASKKGVAFEHLQPGQVSAEVYLTFRRRVNPNCINATARKAAAVPKCVIDNTCATSALVVRHKLSSGNDTLRN